MNILIRVDSSDIIGTGHIFRMLNLANLYRFKNKIYFISKNYPFNLIQKVKDKYTCFEIFSNNPSSINFNHVSWLGESEEEDAQKTINIIKQNNLKLDWIIIDHYAITEKWEKILKPYTKKMCVITDFINSKHNADVLVNQQASKKDLKLIKENVNKDCKILIGNIYIFFHYQYLQLFHHLNLRKQHSNQEKEIKQLKRINIFMGGADYHNITSNIIDVCITFMESIKNNKNAKDKFIFDIIIGNSNKNFSQIQEKIQKYENYKNKFRLYNKMGFIGEILYNADLAIGSPGTTSYERCLMQTPTLMITTAENQKTVIQKFVDAQTCIYLGSIESESYKTKLLEQLTNLHENPHILENMRQNCKKFIDYKKNQAINILHS